MKKRGKNEKKKKNGREPLTPVRNCGGYGTAAHLRPCTARSVHVRLTCLRYVLSHCNALFCLAQVCKRSLASVLPTPSDGSCRSNLVVVG